MIHGKLSDYDYEAVVEEEKEEDEVTWHTPFLCTDPLGSRSILAAVNFLFRSVLRSRCSFSYFVHVSLQRSRGVRSSTATALFPIPLPLDNAWDFGLQRLGKSRRERLAVRRMVHLAVLALNYLHFRQPLKCLPNMQRRPSALHLLVYARLSMLSRAGGPVHEVSILGCGRKSFQLSARFEELLGALQSLGLDSSSPYQFGKEGTEVEVKNNREELIPYRPLCAERLKLTGQANWDPTPFLSDLFYMPFVEPRVNEFDILAPSHLRPDLSGVDKKEVEALCRVWDARGLLEILPEELGCRDSRRMAKVFNNYKSASADRQIGDRRSQNYAEGRLAGPSRDLPTAAALLQVAPKQFEEMLVTSITDRRDFYHQFLVTSERSSRNAIYPVFKASELADTKAYEEFRQSFPLKKKRGDRIAEGDYLLGRGRPRSLLVEEDGPVIACFRALFQGDHLGVEIACDSHGTLLESYGLLRPEGRLRSSAAIEDDDVVQGLVIDDFFVVSKEKKSAQLNLEDTGSVRAFRQAKRIYEQQGIIGSDDKDEVGKLVAKICGAQIDSSLGAVEKGLVSLGSPVEKRLALALLSVAVARFPYTTDTVHSSLVGSWISVMLLRRPAMCIFNEVFRVIPAEALDTERPSLWRLPRKAADELLVASCVAPIMVSNLAVPFLDEVFATDASNMKGGITKAEVPEEVAKLYGGQRIRMPRTFLCQGPLKTW